MFLKTKCIFPGKSNGHLKDVEDKRQSLSEIFSSETEVSWQNCYKNATELRGINLLSGRGSSAISARLQKYI